MDDLSPGLTVESLDDRLVVTGEVDAHTADALAEHLAELPTAGEVRIDMSGVTFIDSSGLRVLIDAHQRAGEQDTTITLVEPSAAVTRLLEISGLVDHLNVDAR